MGRITSASLCAWVMLEYAYLKTEDEGIVGEVFSEASEGQLNKIDGCESTFENEALSVNGVWSDTGFLT